MVKYEIGVMSNKWSLEAKSEDIVKVFMSMFIGKDIPIVIYSPKKGAFMPSEVLENHKKDLDSKEFMKDIHECSKTMKKIV